jgi:exopolyphosphatase/guanosine-5'-triphosphate,3'-diphosphate pyrophosphatase
VTPLAEHRPHSIPGQRVGVVDIGSNSIRLVVFDGLQRAAVPVVNERELCGLGQGLAKNGRLSKQAMACADAGVARMTRLAEAMGVTRLDFLATAAMRDARNGPKFAAALERTAGQPIRVIDAAEEARLSSLGVVSGFASADGIMGDLGGGSLELAVIEGDTVGDYATLPLGALRLIDRGGVSKSARLRINRKLKGVDWLGGARPTSFYAVGGAWRSLARIHMIKTEHPIRMIHGYGIARRDAENLCDVVAKASRSSLETLPDISKRRAEALPVAAMVLKAVLDRVAPESVVFSAFGLREGWLYDLLDTKERARDPLLVACRDPLLAPRRSDALADLLVDWTAPLFPDESRVGHRRRRAATLLSDIAWRDPPDHRAWHACHRALYLPIGGVDHADRAYLAIALATRYGAANGNDLIGPLWPLLKRRERRDAAILGAALRLGYAISGGAPELLRPCKLVARKEAVSLACDADDATLQSETVQRRYDALLRAMASEGPRMAFE